MIVAVLGASPKPDRYANKAIKMLLAHNHTVIPVAPNYETIEGIDVIASLDEIKNPVDTLTVYVGPQNIAPHIAQIIQLKPKRVILNPGTESVELEAELKKHSIDFLKACTLVLLSTGQF